jgi:dynamin 1-like protein
MHHIRNTIPELRAKIADGLVRYRTELAQLGDPINESVNPVYFH